LQLNDRLTLIKKRVRAGQRRLVQSAKRDRVPLAFAGGKSRLSRNESSGRIERQAIIVSEREGGGGRESLRFN